MAKSKSPSVDAQLAALNALRGLPLTAEGRQQLMAALAGKSGLMAAKAAKIVAEAHAADLMPNLVASFDFLLAHADPGCAAKTALAQALVDLRHDDEHPFLAGARHVQMEPAFGGPVDTAAQLRGLCAMGLLQMRHPEALTVLAEHLADPEQQTRILAANALGQSGDPAATLLLRLKVLTGDEHPDVLAECFASLVQLAGDRAVPLLDRFLSHADLTTAEGAALALGASRLPAAFELLCRHYRDTRNLDLRPTLLLAIATLRQEQSLAFLLAELAVAPERTASNILSALAIYRHDEAVIVRIQQALSTRTEPSLRRRLATDFGRA